MEGGYGYQNKHFDLVSNNNLNSDFITSDLWFWGIQVPHPHNTHVLGGHVSLDGSGGNPEPACVWDLWHFLLWCGEWQEGDEGKAAFS